MTQINNQEVIAWLRGRAELYTKSADDIEKMELIPAVIELPSAVFVLQCGWNFEGWEIVGVYSTFENAKARKEKGFPNAEYNYVEIIPVELNADVHITKTNSNPTPQPCEKPLENL